MQDPGKLLERCRAGDPLAWEAFVRAYQARIYGLARQYVRDPEEARDVAQEIFVRVYQRLGQFSGDETFLPWLLRVARNCCVDRLRRRRVRTPASSVPLDEAPALESTEPAAEDEVHRAQRRRLLYRTLDTLSGISREMIVLKEIQGLKLEEIAELLGLPLGTVKSRSSRARIELARELRATGLADGAEA